MIEGGAIAAVAITFAEYTLRLVERPDVSRPMLAVIGIIVVAAVNYVGVKPSKPRAHPSGFSWSDPRPAVPHVDRRDPHSEFPWGSRRREAEIFQWGQAPRRRPLHQ